MLNRECLGLTVANLAWVNSGFHKRRFFVMLDADSPTSKPGEMDRPGAIFILALSKGY